MQIKICPFCGGKAKHISDMGDHWVMCECGVVGATRLSEENAVCFWNTRYPKQAVQADAHRCPQCNREWDTDKNNACQCGAAIRTA